jgi:hypothetical protein
MDTMNPKRLRAVALLVAALVGVLSGGLLAQTPTQTTGPQATDGDVAALKALLVEQQKQIDQLKSALEDQKKMIERVSNTEPAPAREKQDFTLPHAKSLGEVASTTPYIPAAAAVPKPVVAPIVTAAQAAGGAPKNPCEAPPDSNAVPPYLRLGNVCITPIGFMDATYVWRSVLARSSIGSNFGSIPYNTSIDSKLTENRFSAQNSRVGFRIDGDWKGTHFINYLEADFLGTSGASNITVTNGAFVPRIRLFWVDVRKGGWEFLAGQSWSMLTPNRKAISPFPGDIFYSQVFDVNYMAGLTWTRQPGMRVLYHAANNKVTFGFSAENPDSYIGGYSGGGTITLPSALGGLANTQLDQAGTVLGSETLTPDFIAKIAFDPSARLHVEVGGIERNLKIANPSTVGHPQYDTKAGGGVLFGINAEIFKNFRLITTNYWNDGGGRYLFGQAPDAIVSADGKLSLIHSGGTVDGFETRVKSWLWYAYYGGIYIGRNTAIDTGGKYVGYGYTGSPNSQNRNIQEITFGFNKTAWSNPRYGAINLMGQYEYLLRHPWYAGPGPDAAHDNTIYFDVRYSLPGSMPNF